MDIDFYYVFLPIYNDFYPVWRTVGVYMTRFSPCLTIEVINTDNNHMALKTVLTLVFKAVD